MISIIIPTIRPQYWLRILNSIEKSFVENKYEVIFVGPFCNKNLLKNNIRFIESYSNPTVCFQLGIDNATQELIYLTSDDSVLFEKAGDICISFYKKYCSYNDILNTRYREGENFGKYEFPMQYWFAGTYPSVYCKRFVDPNWGLAIQTICNKNFFIEMGGFDCRFQFSNHAHADFSFRVQNSSYKVLQSPCEIANLSHFEGETGDHGPVKQAQEIDDANLFDYIWNTEQNRKTINFLNYKLYSNQIWKKRFDKKYDSYDSFCLEKGYNLTNE